MKLHEALQIAEWYKYFTSGHKNYPPGWNTFHGIPESPPEYVKDILKEANITMWETNNRKL